MYKRIGMIYNIKYYYILMKIHHLYHEPHTIRTNNSMVGLHIHFICAIGCEPYTTMNHAISTF